MKKIIATACIVMAGALSGQAGAYTLVQSPGANGSVSILPDGFVLTGADFADPSDVDGGSYQSFYTQSFAVDTLISFNWSYASNDLMQSFGIPEQDTAGIVKWFGVGSPLVGMTDLNSGAALNLSGSVSNLLVSAGQTFGWYVSSVDGLNGAASLTVSSLVAAPVAAVPEPAAWSLMLAGVGALGLYRRSRKQA